MHRNIYAEKKIAHIYIVYIKYTYMNICAHENIHTHTRMCKQLQRVKSQINLSAVSVNL